MSFCNAYLPTHASADNSKNLLRYEMISAQSYISLDAMVPSKVISFFMKQLTALPIVLLEVVLAVVSRRRKPVVWEKVGRIHLPIGLSRTLHPSRISLSVCK